MPPPETPLTLRRGHILLWPTNNLAFGYLEQLFMDQRSVSLRQWNRSDLGPIACGDKLITTETYQGAAGLRNIEITNGALLYMRNA